jgi:hypothetical protein
MKTSIGSTLKMILATGTVVGALALTAGPLTAATNGPTANGDPDLAMPQLPAQSRVETAILADDRPELFAHSRSVRDALGMPGGVRNRGLHVKDASRGAEYDEITETDTAGQPLSLTQFDGTGQLLLAVRFDRPATASRSAFGRDAALKKASDGLKAAGISPSGQVATDSAESDGGWDVRWQRAKDGIAVRGDEIRVHVRDDGAIGSVGQVVHDLAAAPATRLTKEQARAAAASQTRMWSDRSGAQFSITDLDLQWAASNAAFDASKIGAPETPLRLSWIVKVVPQGSAASYARLVVLYVDAGNGSVIGGDVVE